MPRTAVDLDLRLEHLSILGADGTLDVDLEPSIPDEMLLELHAGMLRARRFDERMLSLHREGRLGTFAPVTGQEASQLGAVIHLRPSDWMVPSYREIAALLHRGADMSGILLFNAGYNEGGTIATDRNDLPLAIPVGSQMLHAAGLGYGLRMQGQDAIVMTFFGDGATSEGDFHEALNFARVFDSPTVFVCENNRYAISLPRSRQTASKTLAQKGFAYDVPAIQVDGNDLLAVYVACGEAAERARTKHCPTLIECLTYRLQVHTTVDDPSKYRSEAEVERWRARDPLPRFQNYLKSKRLLDDQDIDRCENEIRQTIDRAVAEMEAKIEHSEPVRAAVFEHVFAEVPPYTERQRTSLEAP